MDIIKDFFGGAKDGAIFGIIYGLPFLLAYLAVVWIVKSSMITVFKGTETTLATIACALPGAVIVLIAFVQDSFDKFMFALVIILCAIGFHFARLMFVTPLLSRAAEPPQS